MGVPVFHPGHDDLHGNTVVIFTNGPRTVVGRWDAERDGKILMVGAAIHEDGQDGKSTGDWVAEVKKYGIPVQEQRTQVLRADVDRVVLLRDA